MRGAIRKILGLSIALFTGAAVCLYAGNRIAEGAPPPTEINELSRHFGGDPGDGWTLLGGFLLVVAVAMLSACVMLWHRERQGRI